MKDSSAKKIFMILLITLGSVPLLEILPIIFLMLFLIYRGLFWYAKKQKFIKNGWIHYLLGSILFYTLFISVGLVYLLCIPINKTMISTKIGIINVLDTCPILLTPYMQYSRSSELIKIIDTILPFLISFFPAYHLADYLYSFFTKKAAKR